MRHIATRTIAASVLGMSLLATTLSAALADQPASGDITITRPGIQDHTFGGALAYNLSSAWANADACAAINSYVGQMQPTWASVHEFFFGTTCNLSSPALYYVGTSNGNVTFGYATGGYIKTVASSNDNASDPADPHFAIDFNTKVLVTLAISNGSVTVTTKPTAYNIACSPYQNISYYNKPYATYICGLDWAGAFAAALSSSSLPNLVKNMPSMGIMNAFATSSRESGYPIIGLSYSNQQLVESASKISVPFKAFNVPASAVKPPPTINGNINPIPSGAIASPSPHP